MDKRLDRLESKVDKLIDQQSEQNETLTRLTVSVETHEKRSTALEAIVLPLKAERDMVAGALRLIGLLAVIAGAGAALVEIIEFLMK